MLKLGNVCDLHLYKDQQHGFFNYGRNNNVYYYDTLNKIESFLNRFGYIK